MEVMIIGGCTKDEDENENHYRMKTQKRTFILKTLNIILSLTFLAIMLFAFATPFEVSGKNINKQTTSGYRPILDSTILCGYETWRRGHELVFFYIVEKMPRPKIPKNRIENILEKEIRFNAQELSYNGTIGLQCIVNCNGKAGDYQVLKCPDEFVNISCQVINILRTQLTEWEPPIQRGENVDIMALIAVKIDNGRFEVIAPFY